MSEKKELDLLLDLLSLYKKYNSEIINSLGDRLKTKIAGESITKLFNILKSKDAIIRIFTNQII